MSNIPDMSGDDSSSSFSDDELTKGKRRKLSSSEKVGSDARKNKPPIYDEEDPSPDEERHYEVKVEAEPSQNWGGSDGKLNSKNDDTDITASRGGGMGNPNDNDTKDGGKAGSTTAAPTTTNTRSEREERRMEANRQRARDIRKRKKKMVEEMKQQIVQLTMENRQLHRQNQLQQAEIQLLRRGQSSQGMMGRQQQQPTPPGPHLLNHPMMAGSQFLGTSLPETNNQPSNPSARNNSMLTNPAALSGILQAPLGSSMPPLLHTNRQQFLSDNPNNASLGTMSMMGRTGGAGGMAGSSNPQASIPAGMQGLPPTHMESAIGGGGMFSNRDLFFNQLLQQQQQQQFGGNPAGGLRMPRNLAEFREFQEQDDIARGPPGDSRGDGGRKR